LEREKIAKKLSKQDSQVERHPLWHGTTPDAVDEITKNMFNRSYAGKNGMLSEHLPVFVIMYCT